MQLKTFRNHSENALGVYREITISKATENSLIRQCTHISESSNAKVQNVYRVKWDCILFFIIKRHSGA